MSPQDKCKLSFYRDLEPISDSTKVVLVRHIENGQIFVKKRLSAYSRNLYRFLQGNDIPGVPRVYECLDDDDFIIVIEEFVPGQTMRHYMTEQGPLPEDRAIELTEKICLVLERLHGLERPIVCRDLKPENVILTPNDSVVIVDFDAAKFVQKEKVDTVLLGTPGYAAPEQFGFAASDERTDVYAVGVFLNEMLTGCLPQESMAGGRLGRIVERSTALNPKERYRNVADLRLDLGGTLYEANGGSDPSRRFLPPGFRTRVWWKMILAILAYAFAVLMAISYFNGTSSDDRTPGFSVENFALGLFWVLAFCWTVAYVFDYLRLRSNMPANRMKSKAARIALHILIWLAGFGVALFISIMISLVGEME